MDVLWWSFTEDHILCDFTRYLGFHDNTTGSSSTGQLGNLYT